MGVNDWGWTTSTSAEGIRQGSGANGAGVLGSQAARTSASNKRPATEGERRGARQVRAMSRVRHLTVIKESPPERGAHL